jgi:hypothetical protein
MDGPAGKKEKAKDLLNRARLKAQRGDREKAFELFEACIREYLRNRMHWKALAAARAAKTSFGDHPRAQAMLFRMLSFMDLAGEIRKELSESGTAWLKNEVPLFKDLTLDEFTCALEISQIEKAGKGRYAVRQGEKGSDVFVVRKGSLEVIRDGGLVSVVLPGDVFGELEFFSGGHRSAGVRALEPCELYRMPAAPLRTLYAKSPNLKRFLDELYSLRLLMKAGGDLRKHPLVDLDQDTVAAVGYEKGSLIPFDCSTDITIVKHGIVEITTLRNGLPVKHYLKPGSVVERVEGIARAGTNVELIRARIDLLDAGRKARYA